MHKLYYIPNQHPQNLRKKHFSTEIFGAKLDPVPGASSDLLPASRDSFGTVGYLPNPDRQIPFGEILLPRQI